MNSEAQRLAEEAKQLALCIFGDGDVRSDLRELNERIDKLASMIPAGGLAEEARPSASEELAMMIRQLVSALRKARPCSPQDLDYRAINLLRKHGLLGSPLREAETAPTPQQEQSR